MKDETTEALAYEEACDAYFEWAEDQPGEPHSPSESLSVEHYGIWQLENISGPLVAVTADKEVVPVTDFYNAYERLSSDGRCDCAGGMEYRRVLAEWIEAQPEDLDEFISRRANIGPWDIDDFREDSSNAGTKKVKVTLTGNEIVSVSAEFVVEVPRDTTAIELASLDLETMSELASLEWQLGDIQERNVNGTTGMELADELEADLKLVRASDGKIIPA